MTTYDANINRPYVAFHQMPCSAQVCMAQPAMIHANEYVSTSTKTAQQCENSKIATSEVCVTTPHKTVTQKHFQWGGNIEHRFRYLMRQEALDRLSENAVEELNLLQSIMRIRSVSRTIVEMKAEDEQQQLLKRLADALNAYVVYQEVAAHRS